MIQVKHRIKVDTPGLDVAPDVYGFYLRRHVEKLVRELQGDVRQEQRLDTGEERRRTLTRVAGRRTQITGRVFNNSIQGAVDETGAKPHFPPWRRGSRLFKWTKRKGLANETHVRLEAGRTVPVTNKAGKPVIFKGTDEETERISYAIAKKQSIRGLPRPGDRLRKPFETVKTRKESYINASFIIPALLATKAVNSYDRKGRQLTSIR